MRMWFQPFVSVDVSDFSGVHICRVYIGIACTDIAGAASVDDVLKHIVTRVLSPASSLYTQSVVLVERQIGDEEI